jgi:membrane-anchored protein YejM (alkaline phosphatase superfamily)
MIFNKEYTILNFFITLFGAISSASILFIVLYFILFPISFVGKTALFISSAIFILIDIALVIDFLIYRLYKFHINGMVLNILTSPDSLDSIQIGYAPPILISTLFLLFIIFQRYILKLLQNRDTEDKKNLNKNINRTIIPILSLIIMIEKVGYGFASLKNQDKIISNFSVIPLYQPLTFSKFASKYFDYKPKVKLKPTINKNAKLNYPLKRVIFDKNSKKFNIFIIAIDSVRASIVDENITPNIYKFKKEAISLEHHYSGGNSTRFGIFSLFYAINPTYWFNFLNSNKSPLFFDSLKEMGYNIDIISSTNTNWPEFRQSCYINIQDSIKDDFQGVPYQKDRQACNYLLKILDENNKKPKFAFIFFDSPHGYSFPKNKNIFHATDDEINYLTISKDSQELKSAFNAYKNGIRYCDELFDEIIKKLKKRDLYNNSLIIFTSDHGQEFFEPDNFGHNSAFNDQQIHVPMFIKLPKVIEAELPKDYPNSFTSHLDIAPTILSLLGAKTEPSLYSNGANIFDKNYKKEYLFCSNWNNSAIITKEYIYIFSNLPNKIFKNEVRDRTSYKKLKNIKAPTKIVLDILEENKKFLK